MLNAENTDKQQERMREAATAAAAANYKKRGQWQQQ